MNSVSDLELISFVDSNTRDVDDPNTSSLQDYLHVRDIQLECHTAIDSSAVNPEGPAPITHHFDKSFDSHADIFDDRITQ